jgi:uncharacterized protein
MKNVKTIQLGHWALNIVVADHFFSRLRGLLFQSVLKRQQGLLITPCKSVHTIGMGYAIDVVFLSADYRVLKVHAQCLSWRFKVCKPARHTLELLGGEARRLGITEGLQLPAII